MKERLDAGRASAGAFGSNLFALARGEDNAEARAGAIGLAESLQRIETLLEKTAGVKRRRR